MKKPPAFLRHVRKNPRICGATSSMTDAPQENQAPQQRVIDWFGDPVAVARKLWLDGLWEKIMTQRTLIAALWQWRL